MKSRKRLCLFLLAAAMLFAAIPTGVLADGGASPAATASSDREGWIAVSTPEEFLAMESGGAYYLTQDIDFGGRTVPYLVEVFTGMLDGCGYALKNFTLTGEDASAERMGVFAKICESGYTSVINLVIGTPEAPVQMVNCYAAGTTCYDGFLAGQMMTDSNIGVFDNITVYGEYINQSDKKYFAGGIFGYAKKFVMTDCTVYGSLTDAVESSAEKNLGGLIGLVNSQMNRQNVMTGCVNHADISAVGSGSVRAGGLVAFSGSPLKMEDCLNTGSVSGTQYAGGLVGLRYASDLYIKNSGSTGTAAGANSGRLLGGTEKAGDRYLYIVGCGEDDTEVTEVSTLADLQGMTAAGGVWRLTNDLDLQGQSFENFVFSGADGFRGVFDGNGYAVYNFTVNGGSSSDAGFFNFLSKDKDTLITNLSLGKSNAPVTLTTAATGSTAKNIGVLAGYCNNNSTYSTLIDNVQIWAEVTHTGGKANIGGFLGTSRRCAILESSFAGSIGGNLSNLGSNWLNVGGFVADVEADQTLFYRCVNYADVSISTTAGSDVRTAGFVAYATKNNEFVDCANFGSIRTSGGNAPVAAGFQGNNNGTSKVLVYGCTNFGDIQSDRYASGFFSWAKNPAVMMDAVNLGNVSGEAGADAFYNDNTEDGYTVSKLFCTDAENDLNFAMLPGASVRLNTPAGLRFAAQMNTEGLYYERLLRYTGVSYGVLIAPTVYVTNAGTFTREALDAYASGTLGYTGEQRAYVEVESTGAWFGGAAGSVAGSLVNIRAEHYGSSFSGVGYIDLTVGGETVRTVYAADAQARCVKDVAAAALDDVLYADADGTLYHADGSVYSGADENYVHVVESGLTLEGVAGEVSKVSPYTDAQRETLKLFTE